MTPNSHKFTRPNLPDAPAEPRRSERRERRSPLCVLLRICGFADSGRLFSETSSTVNISRDGCCVRLQTRPQVPGTLALQIIPHGSPAPSSQSPLLYQIAWVSQREDAWVVGLSALRDADLLRVAFASDKP